MKLEDYNTEAAMRMHLTLIHGMYVGDLHGFQAVDVAHQTSHEDPDPMYVIPHVHDVPEQLEAFQVLPGSGPVQDGEQLWENHLDSAGLVDEWSWE